MSLDACATLVRDGDPTRFAAAMCAPMPGRGALMAVYAFNVEVSRAPWVTQEEIIAEMRLQWWLDAIAEIYEGKQPRAHEVVGPLAEVIAQHALPRSLFDGIIQARRFDIYKEQHASRTEFEAYIRATSANLMELSGKVLGTDDAEPFQSFGYASGLASLILALPELYARGRSPLPLRDLDRNAAINGQVSDEMGKLLSEVAESGLSEIENARCMDVPREAVPALLAGSHARRVLQRTVKSPETILTDSFERPPVLRAFDVFWRSTLRVWW